jgi:hypothetical protein
MRFMAIRKASAFIGLRRISVFDTSVFKLLSGLFPTGAKSLIHDEEGTDIGRYVI